MKKLAIGLLAAFTLSSAQAATISFSNGSGVYSSSGVTATVSVTTAPGGAGLYYNSWENAIGVGSNGLDGGVGRIIGSPRYTEAETMTVTFSQEVVLDTVWFRQWQNRIGKRCCGDEVHFDYTGGVSGTGSILFSDSGLGDGAAARLDPFAAGVRLTSFTLRPEQDGYDGSGIGVPNDTSVYLHSVDFTIPTPEVPVPAAAWLFGSALLGLAGIARRRTR